MSICQFTPQYLRGEFNIHSDYRGLTLNSRIVPVVNLLEFYADLSFNKRQNYQYASSPGETYPLLESSFLFTKCAKKAVPVPITAPTNTSLG